MKRKILLSARFWIPLAFALQTLPAWGQETKERKRPVTDRPNLGVQLLPIRPGEEKEGVRLNFVYPGSAAEAMGLRAGDELLEMDGAEVPDRKTLGRDLQRKATGQELRFKVRRGAEVLEIRGPMGNFQRTRKAFREHLEREILGKPLAPGCEIVWPDGVDGLKALKGKVGVVVTFDRSPESADGVWRRISKKGDELAKLKQDWIAFAGIYTNFNESDEANLEARKRILARAPTTIPVGVARYPGGVPLNSLGKDPLFQKTGTALLDPEGKVLYLEIMEFESDNPQADLQKAMEELARKFGKKDAGKPAGEAPQPPNKSG